MCGSDDDDAGFWVISQIRVDATDSRSRWIFLRLQRFKLESMVMRTPDQTGRHAGQLAATPLTKFTQIYQWAHILNEEWNGVRERHFFTAMAASWAGVVAGFVGVASGPKREVDLVSHKNSSSVSVFWSYQLRRFSVRCCFPVIGAPRDSAIFILQVHHRASRCSFLLIPSRWREIRSYTRPSLLSKLNVSMKWWLIWKMSQANRLR